MNIENPLKVNAVGLLGNTVDLVDLDHTSFVRTRWQKYAFTGFFNVLKIKSMQDSDVEALLSDFWSIVYHALAREMHWITTSCPSWWIHWLKSCVCTRRNQSDAAFAGVEGWINFFQICWNYFKLMQNWKRAKWQNVSNKIFMTNLTKGCDGGATRTLSYKDW